MRYVFSPVNGTAVRRRACITETVLSVTIERIASKLSLRSNTGGSALNWPEGYGSPGTESPHYRQLLRPRLAVGPEPQEVDTAGQAIHVERPLAATRLLLVQDRPHLPP